MSNKKIENMMLAPLFRLNVAKFRTGFVAEKQWRIFGAEAKLRGRIGFELKRKCCPFPGFRRKSCDSCTVAENCLYCMLFSPLPGLPVTLPDGRSRQSPSPVRPFVIALDSPEDKAVLYPGDTGTAELTLFGPAIEHCALFLEAAVSAIASFPLRSEEIGIVTPSSLTSGHSGTIGASDHPLAWPLSEWVSLPEPGTDPEDGHGNTHGLKLWFVTPVRLVKSERLVYADVSFALIMKAVLRRLRDLRRAFFADKDMGITGRTFYKAAEAVGTSENSLYWNRRKRHSFRQKQDVFLNGFRGKISFTGHLSPFVPLIRAGEIVHIGKGTSAGNGRIMVE